MVMLVSFRPGDSGRARKKIPIAPRTTFMESIV
jgi:hypothetical protein